MSYICSVFFGTLKIFILIFLSRITTSERKPSKYKHVEAVPLARTSPFVFGACGEPEREMVRLRFFFYRN